MIVLLYSTHDISGNVSSIVIKKESVDFDAKTLTNYNYEFPTMRNFSVKVTYNGSNFELYNNPIFDSYLVNYVSTGTPIVTLGQGNFKIYVSVLCYGGDGAVMVNDLCVTANGLHKTDNDENSTILIGT